MRVRLWDVGLVLLYRMGKADKDKDWIGVKVDDLGDHSRSIRYLTAPRSVEKRTAAIISPGF